MSVANVAGGSSPSAGTVNLDLSRVSTTDLEKQSAESHATFTSQMSGQQRHHHQYSPRSNLWLVLSSLLNGILITVVLILFLLHVKQPRQDGETCKKPVDTTKELVAHDMTPSWLPPEVQVKKTLYFNRLYGRPPDEENQKTWDEMRPLGRGFIVLKNDTALPDMPALHQEVPEQHAMVSAFHQMHCVWASRISFFQALNGTSDDEDILHMSHCWDYLRQAVMCHADTTLEWMPDSSQHISKGWGYEHRCRDWDAFYNWAEANRRGNGHGIH